MTASQLQLFGWLLTGGGILFLAISQLLLTRWHRKMLREL